MFLILSCTCLWTIHWSQVLSRKWRCSWSSGDRWCPNYIWVISNFIANQGASYIRDFTVSHGMHLTPAGSGLGHNNWTSSSPAGTGSTPQEPWSAGRPSDNPHRNSRTWYIKTAQDININHTIHSLTKAYQSSLIIKSRITWDHPSATLLPHPEGSSPSGWRHPA